MTLQSVVRYNKTMQETTFEKELNFVREHNPRGDVFVIGVDEAGRGPLAGPVVAAAVTLKDIKNAIQLPPPCLEDLALPLRQGERKNNSWDLVRDSKTLSEKQREKVFDFIHKYFYVGVGIVNSETIDRINILQATFLAMKSAISDLQKQTRGDARCTMYDAKREMEFYCLVDGDKIIPNISISQEAVIGGDGMVKSIAAASIIAKVTRDGIMQNLDQKYPAYGFAKHKGYGTREHLNALRRFGPCSIHRMSFRPVLLSIPENVNKRFSNVLKSKKN